jgi:iron-sulfur cluster assembly accessory protein
MQSKGILSLVCRVLAPVSRKRKKPTTTSSLQTDRAAARLQELQKAHNKPILGFRLGVKTRGCNGMSYTLDYAETRDPFDDVVADKGVTVLVSPQATMSVIGTEMDFVDDKLSSEFVFHNPNATATCGCGESFTTTNSTTSTSTTATGN